MDGKNPMKLSELIKKLELIKKQDGDLEVFFRTFYSDLSPMSWIEIGTDLKEDFVILQDYME
ncbi:hypothetical protein [Methanobacterium spitsbergense]|uniref:Uncharacterized protein n=1 Tax=Methanobacterium spitsbergense TaxID=2874285 RepID=A0A8T5UXF6_9EURY|nr:hypothetical protein [Methanobacterium spitsbergense]MBZ2166977.1 hypothetical protein [Methanobacterium spitsbergense]